MLLIIFKFSFINFTVLKNYFSNSIGHIITPSSLEVWTIMIKKLPFPITFTILKLSFIHSIRVLIKFFLLFCWCLSIWFLTIMERSFSMQFCVESNLFYLLLGFGTLQRLLSCYNFDNFWWVEKEILCVEVMDWKRILIFFNWNTDKLIVVYLNLITLISHMKNNIKF